MAHIAVKYRIYPTKAQMNFINKNIGANRWFWNYCIEKKQNAYLESKRTGDKALARIDGQTLRGHVKTLKEEEETKWLKDVKLNSFNYVVDHFDEAYKKFFEKKAGKPKKHKRTRSGAFTTQITKDRNIENLIDYKNNRIYLGKFIKNENGEPERFVKAKIHRKVDGTIMNMTISKDIDNRYYISFCLKVDDWKKPKSPTLDGTIGIDMGMSEAGALYGSDLKVRYGSDNIAGLTDKINRMERHLKKWSKIKSKRYSIERKKKRTGQSKGYVEAVEKCAVIQCKINRLKSYITHMMTSSIVHCENIDSIAIESLDVKEMIEKKTTNNLKEQKARKRRARRNRIVRLGEISRQLEYKAEMNGKNFVKINKWYPSSKTCSVCGYKNDNLKLTDRSWVCPHCHTEHHRDFNAAENIKNEGYRMLTSKN